MMAVELLRWTDCRPNFRVLTVVFLEQDRRLFVQFMCSNHALFYQENNCVCPRKPY